MDSKQRNIHKHGCGNSLQNAYYKRLFSGFLELRKAKFVAYGKGDKAKGDIGNDADALKLLIGLETDAGDIEKPQAARADKHARYKIRRNVRESEAVHRTRHHKPREHCNGY